MKEMWEKPRILVEEFAPNDYVAACYQLSCQNGGDPKDRPINGETGKAYTDAEFWGEKYSNPGKGGGVWKGYRYYWLDDSHSGACTDPDKNAIQVNGDNGDNISIWESSNWGETLPSEVTYTKDYNNNGVFDAGDLFAWVTFSKVTFQYWLHWAYAGFCDENHPNRS